MSVFVLSPLCTVKDGSGSPVLVQNGAGVSVVAGHTIQIALANATGVAVHNLRCIFSTTTAPVRTSIPLSFTAGPAGSGYIFESVASGLSATGLVSRFGVFAKAPGAVDFDFPSTIDKFAEALSATAIIEPNIDAITSADVSAAEAYADNGDATTLAAAETYADSGDASTLTSAESYTDSTVSALGGVGLTYDSLNKVLDIIFDSNGSIVSNPSGISTGALPPASVVSALGLSASDVSINGFKLTNVADPTGAQDGATKSYVDAVAQGLSVKPTALVLSNSNVASLSGLATTIDGVLVNADSSRVLLVKQTTGTQNGLWLVHTGAWTRPSDFATGSHAASSFVFVEQGTTFGDTGWVCTTNGPNDVVDTNNLTFDQFSGASDIVAGNGLVKVGNTLSVVPNADGSIVVNAGDVQIGVLATDGQHGARGGGTQHAVATTSVAGFMSAADKVSVNNAVPTSRLLTAGSGLTGGGNLSADRSFAVDTSTIATRAYADAGVTAAEAYTDSAFSGGTVALLAASVSAPHITGSGSTPTFAVGAGAGTNGTASVSGTDKSGEITVNTSALDTPSGNSDIITVTFATAYSSPPKVVMMPSNDAAWNLAGGIVRCRQSDVTTAVFKLRSGTTPLPAVTGATYKFVYMVG